MTPPPTSGLPPFEVPGFFIGDETTPGIGDKWRVRFTPPNIPGPWTAEFYFESGPDINVSSAAAGTVVAQPNWTIPFGLAGPNSGAEDFERKGFVLAFREPGFLGCRYLRHSDGSIFLKSGLNSPENFLAYKYFDDYYYDGTGILASDIDAPGGPNLGDVDPNNPGMLLHEFIHEYGSMFGSYVSGMPTWLQRSTNAQVGQEIIGAIAYLAAQGVNSLYMLPMNLGGDGRDVHPFIGTPKSASNASGDAPATGANDVRLNYRVRRMQEWNTVFEYAMQNGILLQLVLAEQEIANVEWLGAHDSRERKLYHKNMVAMFGHNPAIKWNLCEEVQVDGVITPGGPLIPWPQFDVTELTEMAHWIQRWDACDFDSVRGEWIGHPITVPCVPDEIIPLYQAIRDNVSDADWWLDVASLQIYGDEALHGYPGCSGTVTFSPHFYDTKTEEMQSLFQQGTGGAGSSPRLMVIDVDEQGSGGAGVADESPNAPGSCLSSSSDDRRRRVLYDVLLSGGSLEWYCGYWENRDSSGNYDRAHGGGDLRLENFATREAMFLVSSTVRDKMLSLLPLGEMRHDDGLVAGFLPNYYGGPEVLARREYSYLVYYPSVVDGSGSVNTGTLTMHAPAGPTALTYVGVWYQPETWAYVGDRDIFQIPPGGGTHVPAIANYMPAMNRDLVYLATAIY